MGFRDWHNRLVAKRAPSDTVPFYDFDSKTLTHIPRRELGPGAIQVQMEGMSGLVWLLANQLHPGPIRQEPFDEETRNYIRHIKDSFAEHQDLTLDEWEDGFRRDAHPEREIAMWSHAADVYVQSTADEPSAKRRAEVYRCLVACMTAGPDSVWDVFRPRALDPTKAQRVVDRFYGKDVE